MLWSMAERTHPWRERAIINVKFSNVRMLCYTAKRAKFTDMVPTSRRFLRLRSLYRDI